jgi:hypothetical protein
MIALHRKIASFWSPGENACGVSDVLHDGKSAPDGLFLHE